MTDKNIHKQLETIWKMIGYADEYTEQAKHVLEYPEEPKADKEDLMELLLCTESWITNTQNTLRMLILYIEKKKEMRHGISKIKSCPYCGTTRNFGLVGISYDDESDAVYVICEHCGMRGPISVDGNDIDAINQWNQLPRRVENKHHRVRRKS